MVGGAPVTQEFADDMGADGYGKDAMACVALAKQLIGVGARVGSDPSPEPASRRIDPADYQARLDRISELFGIDDGHGRRALAPPLSVQEPLRRVHRHSSAAATSARPRIRAG